MKTYPIKSLILSFFLLVVISLNTIAADDVKGRAIIPENIENPILYHASFQIFNYWFSGLIVFKYLPEKNHFHVVFLSEAGLSLADFIATDSNVECIKTMDVLDRKAAKKYLSRIIQQLIIPNTCSKEKSWVEGTNSTHLCRGKVGKHYYIYTNNNLTRINYRHGLRKQASGVFNNVNYPDLIEIGNKRKTKIELKLINNAIK